MAQWGWGGFTSDEMERAFNILGGQDMAIPPDGYMLRDKNNTRTEQLSRFGSYSRITIDKDLRTKSRMVSVTVEIPDNLLDKGPVFNLASRLEHLLSLPDMSGPDKMRAVADFIDAVAKHKNRKQDKAGPADDVTVTNHGGRAIDLG